jgi:hypothetical protein
MDAFGYRIVRESESAGNLQLHVFARAYRDAWLALHSQAPVGQHAFERLGVAIDFKEPGQPDGGTPG